jgi:dynein light chain roadblock-type
MQGGDTTTKTTTQAQGATGPAATAAPANSGPQKKVTEVDERIERIRQHKGVKGLLIVNYREDKDGGQSQPIFVRSTLPQGTEATNYGVKLSSLARQARNLVRDLDPSNDLTFLRISCKKHEMMIAPDKDYFLIVIQYNEEEH